MEEDFLIIAITHPEFFENEVGRINEILKNKEAHFVHIRKPYATSSEIENLLKGIDPTFYPQIKLHDYFELLENFPLGGIHLNSRNMKMFPKAKSVSKSVHSLQEIKDLDRLDYFFLSPIFDSISKPGYKSAFNLKELSTIIKGKNAIALGGVTPDKFPMLKSAGFQGAAMLGYFFPAVRYRDK